MHWEKRGLVWGPEGRHPHARTHGMVPTPYPLNEGSIRVFVTCFDEKGRGRPWYVDVAAENPQKVVGQSQASLLDIGAPGSFDDNGVVVNSLVEPEKGTLFMYYSGFQLGAEVRYRIFTGLAISGDGGRTFKRHGPAPLLDRAEEGLYFRCAPFVLRDEGRFKMWYIAGSEWTEVNGKAVPLYHLRFQESKDGIHWEPQGRLSMPITDEDEHGFGRPWVIKRGPGDYQLFYSIRRRSLAAYRLGYAESADGIGWIRKDREMGLEVSPGGFDSEGVMYSAVLAVGGRTYCFYNGNHFGEKGFGLAELKA